MLKYFSLLKNISQIVRYGYFKINNHTPLVVPDSDLGSMHFKFFICVLFLSTINQPHDFNIASIQDILKQRPDIEYIKCHDAQHFEYKPFPISRFPELQPKKGLLAESFIAKIPNGQVCSWHGWIKIDNNIIQEFIFPYAMLNGQKDMLKYFKFQNIKKIKGKVAVITMPFDNCYGHWMCNVLGRLALLELNNIQYDWLYVSIDQPFMKETLEICGVDISKVITPFGQNYYIEADELIVPSHIGIRAPYPNQSIINESSLKPFYHYWNLKTTEQISSISLPQNISIQDCFFPWTPLCGYYLSQWLIDYLQNKFLPTIQNSSQTFCDKVFISRKDSGRHMTNEDEVFKLFEQLGFKKYMLSQLSMKEQITLFNNAKIIIATNGSSLTNQLFCKPKTTIIELFLGRSDSTFYYTSNLLNLNHHCIQTMDFKDIEGNQNTQIPLFIIQKFIKNHAFLFY